MKNTQTALLFLHALSPLHAGTGQGVDVIDLPIAREKATGVPYVPGSSIKGVLRDTGEEETKQDIFGPETQHAKEHAGAAQFGDAKLLFLPVRSLYGTFAWVTSPYLLRCYLRDAACTELDISNIELLEPSKKEGILAARDILNKGSTIYLEELDLEANSSKKASEVADVMAKQLFSKADEQKLFRRHFCVVHDDIMSFLMETATEVVARISIQEDSKTVKEGGLWYEENLPSESILYSLVFTNRSYKKEASLTAGDIMKSLKDTYDNKLRQFGGNATVGRGLCRLRFAGGA